MKLELFGSASAWPLRDHMFLAAGVLLALAPLVALAMGLLISALVRTQQVAMMIALVVTLLPALLLSGFIFSHASMPLPLQVVGHLIPATWYLRIVRGVMLAGVNAWPREALVLAGMGVAITGLALKRFQKRLDD